MSALRLLLWATFVVLLGLVTACGEEEVDQADTHYCGMLDKDTVAPLVGDRQMEVHGSRPEPAWPTTTCYVSDPTAQRRLALSVYTAFYIDEANERKIRASLARTVKAHTEPSAVHVTEGDTEIVAYYEETRTLASSPDGPAAYAHAVTSVGEVSLWIFPDLTVEMTPEAAVSLAVAAASEIAPQLEDWAEEK